MATILDTDRFAIVAREEPHVTRGDGGHLEVVSKLQVPDSTKLSAEASAELAHIVRLVNMAMRDVLPQLGIELATVNVQENGNWAGKENVLHVHLYGRAVNAVKQPAGQALNFPRPPHELYDGNERFTDADIDLLRAKILALLTTDAEVQKHVRFVTVS